MFKGHWCTSGKGLYLFYSVLSGGKGPFLFPYLFMMRYVAKLFPSATVMVNLIRCDGGPTTRAASSAAEEHPVSCHITRNPRPSHSTGSGSLSLGTDLSGFMLENSCWHFFLTCKSRNIQCVHVATVAWLRLLCENTHSVCKLIHKLNLSN